MMLLLTLRGTPDPLLWRRAGPERCGDPPAHRVQDPRELNEPGIGMGRDPVRTPMPGTRAQMPASARPTRGCRSTPTGRMRNVAAQRDDPASIWRSPRSCSSGVTRIPRLALGDYHPLDSDGDVLAYERRLRGAALIVLNLGTSAQRPIWAPIPG
jgi:alpha-glucosidase